MTRFGWVFLGTLAFGVAGFFAHRALRSPPAPPPAPMVDDRSRAEDVLLTAGERALAKGQVAAAQLAIESVPPGTLHAERRAALVRAVAAAMDAGILATP
jgi:hypothetical protein